MSHVGCERLLFCSAGHPLVPKIPLQADCSPTGKTQTGPVNQMQTVAPSLFSAPLLAAVMTHGSVTSFIVVQIVDVRANFDASSENNAPTVDKNTLGLRL